MNIWLLSAIEENGYDTCDGFVVRAATEADARALAQAQGGDERWEWGVVGELIERPYWTDPNKSSCVELATDGEAKVILRSFNAG